MQTRVLGDLKDLRVEGLSNYSINNAQLKIGAGLNVNLSLTWVDIKVRTYYYFDSQLSNSSGLPLFGKGDLG